MKNSRVRHLIRQLVAVIPGVKAIGKLIYKPVVHGMLTGCYFESSDFDKGSIQVTYFASVISYPIDSLVFDLPFRIRHSNGGDRWRLDEDNTAMCLLEAINTQAIHFIAKMQSPWAFACEMSRNSNIQSQRAAAVAFARAGDQKRALDAIGKVLPELSSSLPWQVELAAWLTLLKSDLGKGDASALLDQWETASCERLRVC